MSPRQHIRKVAVTCLVAGGLVAALASCSSPADKTKATNTPRPAGLPTQSQLPTPGLGAPQEQPGLASRAGSPGALSVALVPEPGAGLPVAAGADRAGILTPTYNWMSAYSLRTKLDGSPIPAGSVIAAYDPEGVLIGRSTVNQAGRYGPLALYMDDPATPVDEGAKEGDVVSFRINGFPARAEGPDIAFFATTGNLLVLNLTASSK